MRCGNRLSVVSVPHNGPHLLCVGQCCNVVVYECMQQNNRRNEHDGVPHPPADESEAYADWSASHCEVSCVQLATYTLSTRESLLHLDVKLVKCIPYLCIATTSRLLLFKLPVSTSSTHFTDASYKMNPLCNIPLKSISKCTLRYVLACCMCLYGSVCVFVY